MELDKRKMRIQNSIVRTYLETGEPVGSRTLSKDEGLDVSPATIRNEMADLEEMGYIVQPHTSAGRVPTDKGYRFYVDRLMDEQEEKVTDLLGIFSDRMDRVESVLRNMAKVLARNTQYTTMITGPSYETNDVKLIQLSRLDSTHLIAVIVLEGNTIRNKVIEIAAEPKVTDKGLLQLNVLLNSALQGKSLDDITMSFMRSIKDQAGDYGPMIAGVLNAVVEALEESSDERPEVFTSGATNIFKYPELSAGETAKQFLTNLENKEGIIDFLAENRDEERQIKVYIGEEAPFSGLKNCSFVTASYDLGKGIKGTIGVIGPKRMDYEHVIATLKNLVDELDDRYQK